MFTLKDTQCIYTRSAEYIFNRIEELNEKLKKNYIAVSCMEEKPKVISADTLPELLLIMERDYSEIQHTFYWVEVEEELKLKTKVRECKNYEKIEIPENISREKANEILERLNIMARKAMIENKREVFGDLLQQLRKLYEFKDLYF